MHGLCNRALHCFLRDRQGEAVWARIAAAAGASPAGFEVFGQSPAGLTVALVEAAAQETGTEAETLLEDLGTYLVTHTSCAGIRRLLRFGGADFTGFLFGLDDLPDRVRLAVEDLHLPPLAVRAVPGGAEVAVGAGVPRFAAVVAGLIRAMADDYGTLAVIEAAEARVSVRLVEADFAEGRHFALAG